jgi:hypothetical protein
MTPRMWLGLALIVLGWGGMLILLARHHGVRMFHLRVLRRSDGRVYMVRLELLRSTPLCVYLHKICLPDADPELHDHPWEKLWKLILRGGYWEESPAGVFRRAPRWGRVPDLHRIDQLAYGRPAWTLFVGWRRVWHWGFYCADGNLLRLGPYSPPYREGKPGRDADGRVL